MLADVVTILAGLTVLAMLVVAFARHLDRADADRVFTEELIVAAWLEDFETRVSRGQESREQLAEEERAVALGGLPYVLRRKSGEGRWLALTSTARANEIVQELIARLGDGGQELMLDPEALGAWGEPPPGDDYVARSSWEDSARA